MSYNRDLKSHKRSDGVKWVLTAIAFLLVALMIAGICMELFGKGKVKPSEWFKKDEEQSGTVFTPEEHGVKLTFNRISAGSFSRPSAFMRSPRLFPVLVLRTNKRM